VTRGSCRCGSENRSVTIGQGAGPVGQPSPDTSPPRSGSPRADTHRRWGGGGCGSRSQVDIALTDRNQRCRRRFNDEIVKELARTAKLPTNVDTARWAQSIRNAASSFLADKAKLNLPQLRTAIERLYQLNTRAENGDDRTARALAPAVDEMPADVRQWLLSCNTPHDRNIPTAAEILSALSNDSV
jgi:hypothetical protein